MKPRTVLLLIAAMFILPLLLAWLMYAGILEFGPESTRNKGTFVDPPVSIDLPGTQLISSGNPDLQNTSQLLEHWIVFYPLPANCGNECQEHLTTLRQIHRASGRQQSRIWLVIVQNPEGDSPDLASIYDQFTVISDAAGTVFPTLEALAPPANRPGSTYIVDPLGNIMMVYLPGFPPDDLKQDLKRLLKWSKQDEQS